MKAFKAFIKPFEAPQRSVEMKNQLNFFSSSGTGARRVNIPTYLNQLKTSYCKFVIFYYFEGVHGHNEK